MYNLDRLYPVVVDDFGGVHESTLISGAGEIANRVKKVPQTRGASAEHLLCHVHVVGHRYDLLGIAARRWIVCQCAYVNV